MRFQVLFHSPSGVLFTFPSRYYTLSVTRSYLALGDGPPTFTPGFSCPVLLWNTTVVISVSFTRLLLYIAQLSNYVQLLKWTNYMWVLTPFYTSINGLGSYPFARHYLGNRSFTFSSSGYLDGSVPQVPLSYTIYSCMDTSALPLVSFLIQKSSDLSLFATPRSLSQLITSFIGV